MKIFKNFWDYFQTIQAEFWDYFRTVLVEYFGLFSDSLNRILEIVFGKSGRVKIWFRSRD